MYRHGIICFTCISMSSLVGRRACRYSTRMLIMRHVKILYHTCRSITNRIPEDGPSGSKHVEDIKH